jgi:hypothetical protein
LRRPHGVARARNHAAGGSRSRPTGRTRRTASHGKWGAYGARNVGERIRRERA